MRLTQIFLHETFALAHSETFAGVVSLLNDFRIASGKAPLGFLNPLFVGGERFQ